MIVRRLLGVVCAGASAALLMGAADGSWLRRVSPADHARVSPVTATDESRERATAAGAQLFSNECAKCHANDGAGLFNRPPVISDRIANASDGDLFWLMTNGNPWKGMPPWITLPATQRWQLVAYLRALNVAETGALSHPVPSTQGAPR